MYAPIVFEFWHTLIIYVMADDEEDIHYFCIYRGKTVITPSLQISDEPKNIRNACLWALRMLVICYFKF